MGNADFEKLRAECSLEDILLGDAGKDDIELRICAASAMGESHDIDQYPLLRKALKLESSADVRKAIKVAADALEDEFGEDECLACNEASTGGIKIQGDSLAALERGDVYNGNLQDFR